MISALTVNHMKVIKEDGSDTRWMVLGTFSSPSIELINLDNGEVKSFGDEGLTAQSFTQTDDELTENERHEGFEKMNFRRRFGFYEGGNKKKNVHKLHVVSNAGVLDNIKDVSNDPSKEYLDMIAEELLTLTDHCVHGRLRGIAISYVVMDENEMITSNHNFITDGRGIASLNAGIDLVKDYVVEAMRERFGVKKGE